MKKTHFIIKSGDENAGFTAYIKFALNGILYSEQHDLIPVVNFDDSIRNFFYEESYGKNTWEYYFEPVAETSYENVIANNLPKCTLKDRQFRNQNSHPNSERVDTFWKNDRKIGGDEHKGHPKEWLESKRKLARKLMKKYVKVKPHIQKVVDNFVNENFNNKNVMFVELTLLTQLQLPLKSILRFLIHKKTYTFFLQRIKLSTLIYLKTNMAMSECLLTIVCEVIMMWLRLNLKTEVHIKKVKMCLLIHCF
jgi:hypothetical protein